MIMRVWWNWYTRCLEGAVAKAMGVQISLLANKILSIKSIYEI